MHTYMYVHVCMYVLCLCVQVCMFYLHLQKDIRRAMEGQEQPEHQGKYISCIYR